MGKRKYTIDYFDNKPIIDKYNFCNYFIFFGERGDGKTYSALERVIESIKNGHKFIYMRRLHSQIVRKNMIKVFTPIMDKVKQELGSEIYFDVQRGFFLDNGNIVGYPVSIEDAQKVKSIPYVDIEYILYDEFIDYSYMDNEITKFLHIISTICRPPNDNIKILMCGNTILGDCPYFRLFGIDPIKINQGEPYYIKHSLGVQAVVYRTKTKVDDIRTHVKTNKYVGFDDNATVNAIMFGEWEYNICNVDNVDGITWNCERSLIPLYININNTIFELSIYDKRMPIGFVRVVNTQLGKVNTHIKYNITNNLSNRLINKNGVVPSLSTINSIFMDTSTKKKVDIFNDCFKNNRIIFDKMENGSLFIQAYKNMI